MKSKKVGRGAEPGWIQGVRPVSHAPSHKTTGASGIYSSMLFISPYTMRNGTIYKPKSDDVARQTRHNLGDGDRWQLHSRAWPRPLRAVGLLRGVEELWGVEKEWSEWRVRRRLHLLKRWASCRLYRRRRGPLPITGGECRVGEGTALL